MLVVDVANVVGSRPNGWWRDRGTAARNLCDALLDAIEAGRLESPVVVVLEGAARQGVEESERNGFRVVHALAAGDDAIVEVAEHQGQNDQPLTVVTADRELRTRAQAVGADVVGPGWLWERIETRS